jgi:hypothetical protein
MSAEASELTEPHEPTEGPSLTALGREVAVLLRPKQWDVVELVEIDGTQPPTEWHVTTEDRERPIATCEDEDEAHRLAELLTEADLREAKLYKEGPS